MALPRKNDGISGHAHRSTHEFGKTIYDVKVNYAVKQIRRYLPHAPRRRSRTLTAEP
jgi:creatinine amidohydrolase/Fe(II)-dependent formamide hydrolase-like protein